MQDSFHFGRWDLRPGERQLLADGAPAPLGGRAFDLLLCLVEHRDRMVSKDELLARVWPGLVVEENNLSVQVSALRKLLGREAIATVAGRGYRFALPVRAVPAADGAVSAAAPLPEGRATIAVLPFAVLSDDPRLQFLADGLAEDVIALLARVPGFVLISRASSFAFRGQGAAVPEVARQLGVRHVVEGSVRDAGGLLRIGTQLTDAATGRLLWSGRFERPREQAPLLQEDIARGLIAELEPELTRAEIAHIRRQRPENLDAWAHYRQAVGAIALQGWTREAMAEARAQLERAIARDPVFGLAHAHLALLTALSMNIATLPHDEERVAQALAAAERAIGLDDGSSEVLGYAGCALCDLGRHDRGVEVLQRAVDLDPSNAQAHVALGAALVLQGRAEAGIARMRRGMAISPRDRRLGFWGWALGLFLARAEQLDAALAEARLSARRDPRFHLARVLEAVVLERQGQAEAARGALAAARALSPSLALAEIAWTHGKRAAERLGPLLGGSA